ARRRIERPGTIGCARDHRRRVWVSTRALSGCCIYKVAPGLATRGSAMIRLDDHPSVVRFRKAEARPHAGTLNAACLRDLCLDAGADDVGFVVIDRAEIDDQRAALLGLYPWTRAFISIVCRMNREPVRSPARSVANLEFHHVGEHVNDVAHRIVAALESE